MRNRAAEIRQALAEYLDAVDGCDLLARMNASIKVQGLLADLEAADKLANREAEDIARRSELGGADLTAEQWADLEAEDNAALERLQAERDDYGQGVGA